MTMTTPFAVSVDEELDTGPLPERPVTRHSEPVLPELGPTWRRQLGADRRKQPIAPPTPQQIERGLALGRLALTITGLSLLAYLVTIGADQLTSSDARSLRSILETFGY